MENVQMVRVTQDSFRAKLRQSLVDYFSEEELHTLCFDMGLDYESLTAQGKAGKAREMVAHFERVSGIPKLISRCHQLRPNGPWHDSIWAEASGSTPPEGDPPERRLSIPHDQKYRVLIADDDKDWREEIAECLASEGCLLQFATNRQEALDRVRNGRIDLMILNAVLSGEKNDGWRFKWTTLMGRANEKNISVIVVTSLDKNEGDMTITEIKEAAREHGAAAVFFKSRVSFNDLKKSVRHVFATRSVNTESNRAVFPVPLASTAASPSETASSCITWLHLSDLHFETTEKRKYEIREVVEALVHDLTKLRNQSPSVNPDLVFFTGDLANKGKRDEFTQSFDLCFSPILDACGIGKEKLFLVPGNHDVDRSMTADELDAGFLPRITNASDVQALLKDPHRAGYRQQLTQRMEGFGSVLEAWGNLPFSPRELAWGHAFSKSTNYQIGVIGLNSVYTSASFKDLDDEVAEQGRLFVGKPLLELALGQIPNPHPKVCVALLHHPLDWLCSWDKTDIERTVKDSCRFVLHGHAHRTQLGFLGADQRTMQISAGALFKGMKANESEACLHAYNIMRLDLANQRGTLFLRRYDLASKRYGADDTSEDLAPKGEYTFHWDDRRFYGDAAL